ncbi:hypothetical protein [Sulfitobacter sp. S190]|uniref:hypothetical protein n=1 Tax=Sulfitobacter sp. S190 TaxID=2867022 RepID=UPI0021A2EC7D|nr:hypothetical protein [Sulfitobacter sp. S190]UWR23691.1 hypothetical protein K3756_06925 [Sulfitobacter sp. S190]
MLAEILNFVAMPLVFAVVQAVLFFVIMGRAGQIGAVRLWSLAPFLPVLAMIGIYIAGGWITFYQVLDPIPFAVPLYQLFMALVGFIPVFVLAFGRWPRLG